MAYLELNKLSIPKDTCHYVEIENKKWCYDISYSSYDRSHLTLFAFLENHPIKHKKYLPKVSMSHLLNLPYRFD